MVDFLPINMILVWRRKGLTLQILAQIDVIVVDIGFVLSEIQSV